MLDAPSYVAGYMQGKAAGGGGGGDITVESLSVTENGTTTAPSGKAYSPVVVNVPNTYSAADEGKVVSNGALVAQSSDTVTQNGTVNTTLINSLLVNVSGKSGTLTFAENTTFNNYTLDVGSDFDYFVIYATTNPLNIVSGRTFGGLFKDFATTTSYNGIYISSNSGGSAYSGSMGGLMQATKSSSVITFHTNDGAKFATGITYQWYVW